MFKFPEKNFFFFLSTAVVHDKSLDPLRSFGFHPDVAGSVSLFSLCTPGGGDDIILRIGIYVYQERLQLLLNSRTMVRWVNENIVVLMW